jgi:uncharacterized protein (TIGR02265 family)
VGSTTSQSMFEALFDRRLKPTGAFLEQLRGAGYDSASSEARYPTEVWVRCLELARAHRYPQLSREEAYRHLGREFGAGFLETLVGALVSVALPFMTPASFLQRLSGYFRLGRSDSGLTFTIVETRPTACRVVVHNPAAVPGTFVAGMIDAALVRVTPDWSVEVLHTTATDYSLLVQWRAG